MSRHAAFLILAAASLAITACSHKAMEPDELADYDLDHDGAGDGDAAAMLIPELTVAQPTTTAEPRAEPAGQQAAAPKDASTPSPDPAPMMDEAEEADFYELTAADVEIVGGRDRDRSQVMASSTGARALVRGPSPSREKKERRADNAALGAVASADAPAAGAPAYYAPPPAEPLYVAEPEVVVQGNTESFTDHGVNPFTIVTQDALSTFSIDVDTASYTIARRKIESGGLPPQAAVRVEEFVNYFDYDYAQPTSGPFAVHMEAMPDPFRPGHHILRVGVQGDEISRAERPPVHLTFLADVSGSMSSADKLPLAKESMHMLVDGLREDDTVGLCTYAGRVARVLEPTSAANKRAIHDAIEALSSGGSTAMSSGIDIAYEMAWQTFEEGHENRVIIMSDGDANVGNTSWEQMLANIKGYADRGVTVSTIGFGMGNYKDTLMEQLSNNGDGNNYYIDDRDQAQRVFVEDLGGTMVTIARDVKIQVDFNPESVYSYRLIGYENRDIADVDFRNDRVDAGEIGSGHNVTALYDVILRDGYTRELATVRMRWEAPGADKAATERAFAFSHSALKETSYLTSRATRVAYSAATFAEILRGSPHAAEISLERLAQFATQAARPGNKDDMELVSLMRQAAALGVQNVASVY
jgi:Ca-activated chloride channel family protein